MSASSGITVSDDLTAYFSSVLNSNTTRLVKLVIKDESLVHDQSLPAQGDFDVDLLKLQDSEILQDDVPAYILARLDHYPSQWLAIFYVPESAKVKDKMLYASTRGSLTKALGSTCTDSLFATSKKDITPEAYAAHKRHNAAPKPLSSREQELAEIREAESSTISYQGTMSLNSHLNTTGVGFRWSQDAEDALVNLSRGEGCAIVVIQLEPATELLTLTSFQDLAIEGVPQALPHAEPCYAFLAWPHSLTSPPRREICFIYSCPGSSPIKHRMLYSSGSLATFRAGRSIILSSSPLTYIASRKIETSDPGELDESYLRAALSLEEESLDAPGSGKDGDPKPFSRPKRPTKKR